MNGHFKLDIKEWTLQIGHQRMDSSNWTSMNGHFKFDINVWTLQIISLQISSSLNMVNKPVLVKAGWQRIDLL